MKKKYKIEIYYRLRGDRNDHVRVAHAEAHSVEDARLKVQLEWFRKGVPDKRYTIIGGKKLEEIK